MPWSKSFKCKYCNSIEDLIYPLNWRKGKKLVNEHTGEPHNCKRDKVSSSGQNVWKKSRNAVFYHGRSGEGTAYKFGCDAPPNTPTHYVCGKCGTELEEHSYEYLEINSTERREKLFQKTGCNCILIGLNCCSRFCQKCSQHPDKIYVLA